MTPEEAYNTAYLHGPSDVTRTAACRDPYRAFAYALYVDECALPGTRAAVDGTDWQDLYDIFVPDPK